MRLTDDARRLVLTAWQERKKEERLHPFLQEQAPFGLVPYLQVQMLARHLRGVIDGYPHGSGPDMLVLVTMMRIPWTRRQKALSPDGAGL